MKGRKSRRSVILDGMTDTRLGRPENLGLDLIDEAPREDRLINGEPVGFVLGEVAMIKISAAEAEDDGRFTDPSILLSRLIDLGDVHGLVRAGAKQAAIVAAIPIRERLTVEKLTEMNNDAAGL